MFALGFPLFFSLTLSERHLIAHTLAVTKLCSRGEEKTFFEDLEILIFLRGLI